MTSTSPNCFSDLATQAGNKLFAEPCTRESRAAAYDSLSGIERSAHLLSGYIGQVNNGGHQQWVGNGFAQRLQETLVIVTAIGTAHSATVASFLQALAPHINFDVTDEGCCGNYWVESSDRRRGYYAEDEDDDGSEEEEQSPGVALAESFDGKFYDICEEWAIEVTAWLEAGAPDRSQSLGRITKAPLTASTGAVRYPQIPVTLVGQDSNAFNLVGVVKAALKKHGVSPAEICEFQRQALAGNYDALIQTCMRWVDVG